MRSKLCVGREVQVGSHSSNGRMYKARLKKAVWKTERGEEGVRKGKEEKSEGESKAGRKVDLGFLTQMPFCLMQH